MVKNKEKKERERLPSAVDDCADVTSRYEKFKKKFNKPKFPPVEYEKPPHH